VIRFGSFVQFKRTKRNGRKRSLYLMFSRIGLCVSLKIFLSGQWDCWIWCFEFLLVVTLSELTIQCVVSYLQTGFLHITWHFAKLKNREFILGIIFGLYFELFLGIFLRDLFWITSHRVWKKFILIKLPYPWHFVIK